MPVTWTDYSRGPYLEYVNGLSKKWPHLQFLSDFMEVGTHPLRWDQGLLREPGAYSADPNMKGEGRLLAFHLQVAGN